MNREYIHWIIDDSISERNRNNSYPLLSDAAENAGYKVHRITYKPFMSPKELFQELDALTINNLCVISHGSIQFINKLKTFVRCNGYANWQPVAYFNDSVKSYHKFAAYLGEYLLNSEYIILPFAEFARRGVISPMFVKPLSGLKEFTGQVVDADNFAQFVSDRKGKTYEPIDPETLLVISPAKEILSEFRYIIADRKVVTGSEYRWDNKLDIRIDTMPHCDELANKIAGLEWQADTVYVCDIADTRDGPKVIELNSFSSSGLYACDTNAIVREVSKAAWSEYTGSMDF